MKDEVAARKPIDFTNKDYDTYEQLAEALFKREGIENPGKRRMQARIEDLKKTNPDIKDGELKGKEITANVSEELYNKTTEEKQIAEEFNKTLQTREEADSIAQRFYQIADDNAGMNSMNKMQKLLDEEVTPDNILHVLDAYDKHKHGDSSIIDTVTSEVGAGGTKAQRKVLNTIMDKLAKAAENAGVSAGDIEKAKTDFTNSMDKEFNAVMRRTNPKDMEKAIDFLRGAIVAKQTGNIQDMTDAEAIAAFNADFAATDAEAQKAYKDAREDEGWTARAGDTVLGWFGCTTIEDMDTKLGKNAADVKRLAAAAGDEAEFKKVYKEVFGVEFDKNKIAARDAALGNYQQAQNLSSTINITSGLLEKSGTMDYSALRSEIKDKFQFDDATIDAAIENYAGLLNKDISSDAGKKEVLVRFLEETHNQATAGYREVTKGKSVEQMGKDLDLLTKSAFGTNDIVKDVMQFNENQKTTEMVTEAAFEIAGTIALQFIPGLGQVAAARLAVSAARWGTKAVKVANYAEKAFAATKNLQNLNKATKIGTQMVNAGAATMAVDLSNGKSVREATEKALMNMSFAGVGAGSSILAPKLMQTFGITNRALANEIAEEIMNAAGSYGITKLSGGEYGSQDAFIDFASGLIIARLSHIKTPAAKDVPDTPETQPRDNAPADGTPDAPDTPETQPRDNTPADGTPDAPDTPETQPRDNTPADGTPVLDKAASKGKATPSSVKVGDKKAEKIKDEVNEAASNPDISGEDLAHIRNEAGGIENRDVRRDAEHKIDNAAENLSPEERAAFDAANRANAQKNVDHIFEKHSELNSADTRVMNDYINNTDDASVLRELKEKLNEKEHTYGGVTANYDRLRKAIDDKIAALEPAPVKPNTQQHDDVVAMLNEKAKTGKGLSESDFTQLKEYLATINDEAQLKELKGLLGGKKMTSAQKKQLKEALAAKTEELKNTPAPAPEAEPVETPAAERINETPETPDAPASSPADTPDAGRVNDAPASSPAETPNAEPDKAEVAGEDVVVTPEPVKDTPAAPVHNEPDPIVKPAETPDAEPVNDTPEAPASKPADAPATPPQNEPKHIWGEVSDDNVNPTPEPVKQADTPIVEKNEFRYPTPEEKFAMGQIGNNIGRAKTLDDLDKAQAWLDKMPDCDQKSRLAAQLDAKRQQITVDVSPESNLNLSKSSLEKLNNLPEKYDFSNVEINYARGWHDKEWPIAVTWNGKGTTQIIHKNGKTYLLEIYQGQYPNMRQWRDGDFRGLCFEGDIPDEICEEYFKYFDWDKGSLTLQDIDKMNNLIAGAKNSNPTAANAAETPATPPQNEPGHIWAEVSDDNVVATPDTPASRPADTPAATPHNDNEVKTPDVKQENTPANPVNNEADVRRQHLEAQKAKIKELDNKYESVTTTHTINGRQTPVKVYKNSQQGSNIGYWMQNLKTGELSYVKYPPKGRLGIARTTLHYTDYYGNKRTVNIDDQEIARIENELYGEGAQAKSEALAADLYRAAGINAPEIELITDRAGNTGTSSKFLDNLETPNAEDIANIRKGFAADCWLANWDALKEGNIMTQNGQPIRTDVGGSLCYRARGARKGTAFGENVNELTSFFSGKSLSRKYLEGMSRDELIDSLKTVTTIDDKTIISLVEKAKANGISNPEFLKEMLIERRNYMKRFQTLCEANPQKAGESIADYVARIQKATPKTTYNIGGRSFEEIPVSSRIYGNLTNRAAVELEYINKHISIAEHLTPSQKRIFEASYEALQNSRGRRIHHNATNVLTQDNLLHSTSPQNIESILQNGLVSREYSGQVGAGRSDGDPGSMTPMCADVWDVQDNYSIKDYFSQNRRWNEGEANFLPNPFRRSGGVVIVFDKKSVAPTLIDNSFSVSKQDSELYKDGNMSGHRSYTTHRAVPVGLPSNAIDRIIVPTDIYGQSYINRLQQQIQKSGLDIKIYDTQGNLLFAP